MAKGEPIATIENKGGKESVSLSLGQKHEKEGEKALFLSMSCRNSLFLSHLAENKENKGEKALIFSLPCRKTQSLSLPRPKSVLLSHPWPKRRRRSRRGFL